MLQSPPVLAGREPRCRLVPGRSSKYDGGMEEDCRVEKGWNGLKESEMRRGQRVTVICVRQLTNPNKPCMLISDFLQWSGTCIYWELNNEADPEAEFSHLWKPNITQQGCILRSRISSFPDKPHWCLNNLQSWLDKIVCPSCHRHYFTTRWQRSCIKSEYKQVISKK